MFHLSEKPSRISKLLFGCLSYDWQRTFVSRIKHEFDEIQYFPLTHKLCSLLFNIIFIKISLCIAASKTFKNKLRTWGFIINFIINR